MSIEKKIDMLIESIDRLTFAIDGFAVTAQPAAAPEPEKPAAAPEPEKPAAAPAASAITVDDLRADLKAITEKHGRDVGRTLIRGVLAPYNVQKVTDAPEKDWPAIHAEFRQVANGEVTA